LIEVFFVLVRPKYPINVGLTARVIKNFGFKRLVLISPRCEIDDVARRFASHAQDVLSNAKSYNSIEKFVKEEEINFLIGTTAKIGGDQNPRRVAILLPMLRDYEWPKSGRIALLFGSEDTGLTNEELDKCDAVVTIPTSLEYPVMNLSHAVAVIAYELGIALNKVRETPYRPSTPQERAILVQYLDKLVRIIMSDAPEGKIAIYRDIVRNLVGRAFLSGREVHSLIGFFRRVLAKVQCLRNKKYGD